MANATGSLGQALEKIIDLLAERGYLRGRPADRRRADAGPHLVARATWWSPSACGRGTWDGARPGRPRRGGVLPGLRVPPGRSRGAAETAGAAAELVAATAGYGPRSPRPNAAIGLPATRDADAGFAARGVGLVPGRTSRGGPGRRRRRRHRHLRRGFRPLVPTGRSTCSIRSPGWRRRTWRGSPGRRSGHCGAAWYPSAPPRPLAWLDRDQAPGGVIEEEAMSTPQGGQSGSGQEGSQRPGQQPGSDQPADADATTVYRPGDYGVSDSSGGGSGGPGSPGSSGPSSADPYSGGSSGSAGDSPYSSSSYVPPTSAQPSYGQQPSYGGQPGYDPSSYGQSGAGRATTSSPVTVSRIRAPGRGTTSSPDTVSRSRAGRVISSRATARTTTSNPATASSPAGRTTASPTVNPARTASRPTASRQQDTGSRPATAAIRAARPRAASRRRRRRRRSRTRA